MPINKGRIIRRKEEENEVPEKIKQKVFGLLTNSEYAFTLNEIMEKLFPGYPKEDESKISAYLELGVLHLEEVIRHKDELKEEVYYCMKSPSAP